MPGLQSPPTMTLEPKKIKSVTVSVVSPSICHKVMGPDAMILVFWMLSFKPAFSLSSFMENAFQGLLWFFPGGMVWSEVEGTMATLPGLASRGDAHHSSSVGPPQPVCLVSNCCLPTPVSPLTTYGVTGNLFFLFFSCAYLIFPTRRQGS